MNSSSNNHHHRHPLPIKDIEYDSWTKEKHPEHIIRYEKVLFWDPTELYNRLGDRINPNKRHQGLSIEDCFPKIEGKCACGCDKLPKMSAPTDKTTWQQKWATPHCSAFAGDVVSILNFYFGKAQYYIRLYHGNKCYDCKEKDGEELDHIIGVKHGGGGCWLSNYRWLCRECHRSKTNKDFGFKKKPKKNQIELFSSSEDDNNNSKLPFS